MSSNLSDILDMYKSNSINKESFPTYSLCPSMSPAHHVYHWDLLSFRSCSPWKYEPFLLLFYTSVPSVQFLWNGSLFYWICKTSGQIYKTDILSWKNICGFLYMIVMILIINNKSIPTLSQRYVGIIIESVGTYQYCSVRSHGYYYFHFINEVLNSELSRSTDSKAYTQALCCFCGSKSQMIPQ